MHRARRLAVPLIVALSAFAGCNDQDDPPPEPPLEAKWCRQYTSKIWDLATTEIQMPFDQHTCGGALGTGGLETLQVAVEYLHHDYVFSSGMSQYTDSVEMWTKQTLWVDSLDPPVQRPDWAQYRQGTNREYVGNVCHMSGGVCGPNHADYVVDIGFDMIVGWPPVKHGPQTDSSSRLEQESLVVKYVMPNNSPNPNKGYTLGKGIGMFVTEISRGNSAGPIIGVTEVEAGDGAWFTSTLGIHDTLGMRVQWYLNGTIQPADTGARFYRGFTTAGTYTIRADQKIIDTTFVTTKVLTVNLNVMRYCPTEVSPYTSEQCTASASGGTGGYTYTWSIDNSYYGTGSSIYLPTWYPESQHEVTVEVVDGASHVGGATGNIIVNTCPPEEEPCEWSGPPGTGGAKRPVPKPMTWWKRLLQRLP